MFQARITRQNTRTLFSMCAFGQYWLQKLSTKNACNAEDHTYIFIITPGYHFLRLLKRVYSIEENPEGK